MDVLNSFPISSESLNGASESYVSLQPPVILATSFDFFPQESTIVFAGDPPHIYQFPHKSTLPQIREILESETAKTEMEGERYISRLLEIMKIRDEMGVRLPKILREKRVTIGLPQVATAVGLDYSQEIEAWQTPEAYVESLDELVQRIDINPNSATESRNIPPKISSNDEEGDTYQGLSDRVNPVDDTVGNSNDLETSSANFCACTSCTKGGRKTYFNIRDMQPSPTVRVRGGGNGIYDLSNTHPSSPYSPHLSPLLSSPPSPVPKTRSVTPSQYRTFALQILNPSNNHKIATANGPLSTRLSNLLFTSELARERENSIRRFNWRHIKRMNPQFKDKCSRGFQYRENPRCEEWASQLDRHREYCDYCQTVFVEEEYTRKRESDSEDVGHEYDATVPNSSVGGPWENGTWPEDTEDVPFPVVEDPNPRLRGGASYEYEMAHEKGDTEDWCSEWYHLAAQAGGTKHMPRTFRNSTTLSTKTQIQLMEPVVRDFESR